MNIPRFIAALALLLLLLLTAWVVMHLEDETSLGPPRTKDKALPAYVATLPRIGDFKGEFNINEVNPFVPFEVSQSAAEEIVKLTRPKPVRPTTQAPPPPANPVIPEVPLKPQYPKLKPKDIGAPECLGVIRKGDTAVLVARRPGEEKANLEVGDELNGWKLQSIGVGVARFTDPAGEVHELPIGTGEASATPSHADAATAQPAIQTPVAMPSTAAPLRPGHVAPMPQQTADPAVRLGSGGMQPRPAPEMVPLRPRPK